MSGFVSGFNAIPAAEHMINSVVVGVVIAGLVWVLLRAFSSDDSKTCFAVWLVALFAVVGLPLMGWTAAPSSVVSVAPHLSLSSSWADYALAAWALISLAGIIRIAVGLLRLRALLRRCRSVSIDELPAEAQQILRNFAGWRRVQVLLSAEITAPTAVGFFHPAILLPAWALDDLTDSELRAVLLHEFGHLIRWDDWTNLLQKLARAVFFFHPAVWWIDSKLCLEREIACDDLVLAETGDSRSYAKCLISLAEKSMMHRGMALAVAAVGRMKQMAHRLSVILDPARATKLRISKFAVTSAVTVAFAALVASPHLPALVIFEDGTNGLAAESPTPQRIETVQKVNASLSSSGPEPVSVVPAVLRVPASQQNKFLKVSADEGVAPTKKHIFVPKRNAIRTALQLQKRESEGQGVLLVVETHFFPNPAQSLWIGDDLIQQDFYSMPRVTVTVFRFNVGRGNRIVHSELESHVI